MKFKLLLVCTSLLFLSGCAGSDQRFTAWQQVNQANTKSVEQRYLVDQLVEITEIKERNETARAFSPYQQKPDCEEKESHQQNISGRRKRSKVSSKGKGSRSPANDLMQGGDNDIVLEGMDVITSKLSELIELSQGDSNCEDNQTSPAQQGNPITVNANGATGGITINIGSPGAVATTNAPEKEKGTSTPIVVSKPPKSDMQAFWDNLFGFGNNTVNAIASKADVLSLGVVAATQANKYSHYEDNNGRDEYFDYSDRSDNSVVNGLAAEE